MKRILSFITLLLAAGCSQSYVDEAVIPNAAEEFYAFIEGSSDTDQTRTYVDGNITTRWHADDYLTIFKKETYNREYKFTGVTGANSGGFKQVSVDDDFYSAETLDYNYAVYPHSDNNRFIKETLSFEITMQAEQTYAENTYGQGANIMVAVSESSQLLFKNVGSYLRVRLWGDNTAVSSITITSNGDEAIAGKALVKPTLGGDPTCVMTGSTKSITLTCPTPVAISESESTPTDFWIVLPPVTFEDGFTVMVKGANDEVQTYEINNSGSFTRNKYYDLKRKVTLGETIDLSSSIPNNQIWYTTTDGSMISVPNTHPVENEDVFGGATILSHSYNNGLGIMVFDKDITRIGMYAFRFYTSLKSIVLPNSVTEISFAAFEECSNLESISMPNSLVNVANAVFEDCPRLKKVNISNILSWLRINFLRSDSNPLHNGAELYLNNVLLEDLTIPMGITNMNSVFANCKSLKSITLPDGLTTIDNNAFYKCSSLRSVYCKPTTPPALGYSAFYGNASDRKIYVPANSVNAYKEADGWEEYAEFIFPEE